MAGKSDDDEGVGQNPGTPVSEEKQTGVSKKKRKGLLSRIWSALFSLRKDDFESVLERISKEEAIIVSRMRRRSRLWARMKRHIIMYSMLLEFIAVGYAILTARASEHWKERALRVLPMFAVPFLASIMYSGLGSFINILNQKDQKTSEKLQTQMKSKVDELKERTNYYITQQLIQKYDADPAARAAAAAILASKLGADSGLNVYLGDTPELNSGKKSHDADPLQSSGLRNRKQPHNKTDNTGATPLHHSGETTPGHFGSEIIDSNSQVIDHHHRGRQSSGPSFGWLDRVVALLVGEDPTQCFALICQNCHMHNGLASKEDFPHISYICPHCSALNGPKQRDLPVDTQAMGSTTAIDDGRLASNGSSSEVQGEHVSKAGDGSVLAGGSPKEMLPEGNVKEVVPEGSVKERVAEESEREKVAEGSEK